MAIIEKFLGKRVEIPEDRRYDLKQGLWGKCVDETIVFGLTQPALVLLGGVKDLDMLIEENQKVLRGQEILFMITGKILYIETPTAGNVFFNKIVREDPSRIARDPYDQAWLFLVKPEGGLDRSYESLASPATYIESLRGSEGFKNPEGLKGGVSGICKAVYTGIGDQKI